MCAFLFAALRVSLCVDDKKTGVLWNNLLLNAPPPPLPPSLPPLVAENYEQ